MHYVSTIKSIFNSELKHVVIDERDLLRVRTMNLE